MLACLRALRPEAPNLRMLGSYLGASRDDTVVRLWLPLNELACTINIHMPSYVVPHIHKDDSNRIQSITQKNNIEKRDDTTGLRARAAKQSFFYSMVEEVLEPGVVDVVVRRSGWSQHH